MRQNPSGHQTRGIVFNCVVIDVSFSSAEEQWEKELDNELQEFELVDDGAQNDDDDLLDEELDLK